MHDEQMIEAFASHTAQEALTDGVGLRGVIRGLEQLDATGLGNPIESHPKLGITITDEILRTHAIGSGFANLLCRPSIRRRACHADVDHSPRVQFDNEKGEQRSEKEIRDRQKIAGPGLLGLSMNERPPPLPSWPSGTDQPHVL